MQAKQPGLSDFPTFGLSDSFSQSTLKLFMGFVTAAFTDS